jgi:hypothetical protein
VRPTSSATDLNVTAGFIFRLAFFLSDFMR